MFLILFVCFSNFQELFKVLSLVSVSEIISLWIGTSMPKIQWFWFMWKYFVCHFSYNTMPWICSCMLPIFSTASSVILVIYILKCLIVFKLLGHLWISSLFSLGKGLLLYHTGFSEWVSVCIYVLVFNFNEHWISCVD